MLKENSKCIKFLILVICLNVLFNYLLLSKNVSYFAVSEQVHQLDRQVVFNQQLKSIITGTGTLFIKLKGIISLFNAPTDHPRLVYFIAAIMNYIFGRSTFVTEFSNIIYLIILLISVYLIGKECFNSCYSGLVATVILSYFNFVRGYSVACGLDFPLTAWVALSFLLLLRTSNFKVKGYSLLFGIVFGLGILIKGQILIFFIGPLTYTCIRIILEKDRRSFFNMVFFLIIAIVLSSVWWYGNLGFFCERFIQTASLHTSGMHMQIFTIKWLLFYLFAAITGTGLVFLLFLISFNRFLRSKEIKVKPLLLLWLFVPYIIFTFIATKWDRYYFPSLPAIALITSYGIIKGFRDSRYKIYKIIVAVLLVIAGFRILLSPFASPFEKNNYDEMANLLVSEMHNVAMSDKIKIAIIEDSGFSINLEAGALKYLIRLKEPLYQISWGGYVAFRGKLADYNFVITGNDSKYDNPATQYELDRFLESFGKWVLVRKVVLLPRPIHIFLFRRT